MRATPNKVQTLVDHSDRRLRVIERISTREESAVDRLYRLQGLSLDEKILLGELLKDAFERSFFMRMSSEDISGFVNSKMARLSLPGVWQPREIRDGESSSSQY